ncbi:hypothetical protein Celaphus_00005498, partial [Cervus elaphus hippelaphus]
RIEACLQTVVECNPWFPDEGSFDLEIWHRAIENRLIEPNDSGNDSLKTPFNIKTDNTFLNNNNLPPSKQRLSESLALQSQVSEDDCFSTFPVLRNIDTQRQIMPQYEGINLFHMQQMKKAVTMYGPHSPFTREILNAMLSFIITFILYDWQILIKALLKPGEYLQ